MASPRIVATAWLAGVSVVLGAGAALADPTATAPAPAPEPTPPSTTAPDPAAPDPAAPARTPRSILSSALLMSAAPPRPVPSLRVEAARVANQRFDDSWRFPDLDPSFGFERGGWFVGAGRYRPLSARSAALHGGSMASTLLGELLLAADSPLAAAGALLTGATLDAAAAEADQQAEARR